MTTEALYTKHFANLAHRAARVGCYIDIEDVQAGDAGPYVLRNASWDDNDGYDAHGSGYNLEMIETALVQIELEAQLAGMIDRESFDDHPRDIAIDSVLNLIMPEKRKLLELQYNLRHIAGMAWDRCQHPD